MCSLTQLWFDSSQMLEQEFSLLRKCLGKSQTSNVMSDCAQMIPWLDSLIASQSMSLRAAHGMLSPSKQKLLIAAEAARWPWQPERWLVLLAAPQGGRSFGRAVVFSPYRGGWKATDLIDGVASNPKR